ncbi:MAG: nitronate monooxygenase [Firmicutes bacterium]|nr:nitronate monooxygenase [Bacillota bacterium]
MNLKPLVIGDLTASVPIIQGGMGVGISLSSLAGAVAAEGGIGVISAAQPGYDDKNFIENSLKANLKALARHIKKAKEISKGGIIGVNIMRASKNYSDYVDCCVKSGADLIISGAGLPTELPALLKNTAVKFAPIVSSLKAAKVLFKLWDRRYETVSDFVVIEGPKAGGHLGFTAEEAESLSLDEYDSEVAEIVKYVKSFEEKYKRKIPVVYGGGVFDKHDIEHYISLGCDGVQMGTRFVATEECDAPFEYKMSYVNSKKEDIVIVKSPVGMPGRALHNEFIKKRERENEKVTKCFDCMERCNPATTPYCISMALIKAAKGDINDSLLFCGENAYRINKITTVKELMKELTT